MSCLAVLVLVLSLPQNGKAARCPYKSLSCLAVLVLVLSLTPLERQLGACPCPCPVSMSLSLSCLSPRLERQLGVPISPCLCPCPVSLSYSLPCLAVLVLVLSLPQTGKAARSLSLSLPCLAVLVLALSRCPCPVSPPDWKGSVSPRCPERQSPVHSARPHQLFSNLTASEAQLVATDIFTQAQ